jgi:hypothetical protein
MTGQKPQIAAFGNEKGGRLRRPQSGDAVKAAPPLLASQ